MIYLLKQGERYKVSETVEDGWEQCDEFDNAAALLTTYRAVCGDNEQSFQIYMAMTDYLISCIEDRSKLEFHLRQKNLAE